MGDHDREDPKTGASRWLLAAASTIICLLILEGGMRLYILVLFPEQKLRKYGRDWDLPPERHRYKPDPDLIYTLNEIYRSPDGRDRHNSLGFRGEEFPLEKPEGLLRIACIGGSTTYSTGVSAWAEAYPAVLERLLAARTERNLQVINAGVPGYDSWDSLGNLRLNVLKLKPDLVIVYHGTNDVHTRLVPPELFSREGAAIRRNWDPGYGWWDHSLLLRYIGVRAGFSTENTLRVRTKNNYRDVMTDPNGWLDRNGTGPFKENLAEIVERTRQSGGEAMLMTWAFQPDMGDYASEPYYQRGYGEMNEAVREVAEATGALFFDLAAVMPREKEYWRDGRHVNSRGAEVKAGLIAEAILPWVRGGDGPRVAPVVTAGEAPAP